MLLFRGTDAELPTAQAIIHADGKPLRNLVSEVQLCKTCSLSVWEYLPPAIASLRPANTVDRSRRGQHMEAPGLAGGFRASNELAMVVSNYGILHCAHLQTTALVSFLRFAQAAKRTSRPNGTISVRSTSVLLFSLSFFLFLPLDVFQGPWLPCLMAFTGYRELL